VNELLEVKDLHVHYGNLAVLRGTSLTMKEGELISIVGSNGAGKTTLLKAIAGLITPSSGFIEFMGEDITSFPAFRIARKGVRYIPEGRWLFSNMTVLENLELGAYHNRNFKEGLERIHRLFPILREREKQLAGTLSGGEQQMLAIARGLISKPKLLMLDEPTQGLAPVVAKHVLETIKTLREEGVSILLVEQNAALALEICDRAYVIENGEFSLEGSGKELLGNPKVKTAYLGF
jgi:branched-chain amino acid transport system ATP-binding protein